MEHEVAGGHGRGRVYAQGGRGRQRVAWYASMVAGVGGGRGNLRVAKIPPLQAAWRGGRCDIDHHLRPCGDQQERLRGV